LHQAMRGDELVKHFLKDVLSFRGIQHTTANEVPQATRLAPDGGRDLSILFGSH
jgi:hypothetical protein